MDELQKTQLKVDALKESFTTKTLNYEDQIANLRVEYTIVVKENEALKQEVESLRGQINGQKDSANDSN